MLVTLQKMLGTKSIGFEMYKPTMAQTAERMLAAIVLAIVGQEK
jgi:hypothetical protein